MNINLLILGIVLFVFSLMGNKGTLDGQLTTAGALFVAGISLILLSFN